MALDLPVGENVSVPPADTKRLIVDGDGSAKLLSADGSRENLVIPATTLVPGTMSIDALAFIPKFHATDLTDATVAIAPGTLTIAAARLPVGTLTANRELTLETTNAVAGDTMFVLVQDLSAFTYIIRNGVGGLLATHGPNATRAKLYSLFLSAGEWIFSQAWYVP